MIDLIVIFLVGLVGVGVTWPFLAAAFGWFNSLVEEDEWKER